jgi:hypothetical protein
VVTAAREAISEQQIDAPRKLSSPIVTEDKEAIVAE